MDITRGRSDRQQRNKNPLHVHPGRPEFAEKQLNYVLRKLKEAGTAGVPREDFLFGTGVCAGRRITQCGARIHELEQIGYIITSQFVHGRQFVTYFLKHEPSVPQQVQSLPPKKPAAQVPTQQASLFLSTASGDRSRFVDFESGKLLW